MSLPSPAGHKSLPVPSLSSSCLSPSLSGDVPAPLPHRGEVGTPSSRSPIPPSRRRLEPLPPVLPPRLLRRSLVRPTCNSRPRPEAACLAGDGWPRTDGGTSGIPAWCPVPLATCCHSDKRSGPCLPVWRLHRVERLGSGPRDWLARWAARSHCVVDPLDLPEENRIRGLIPPEVTDVLLQAGRQGVVEGLPDQLVVLSWH